MSQSRSIAIASEGIMLGYCDNCNNRHFTWGTWRHWRYCPITPPCLVYT